MVATGVVLQVEGKGYLSLDIYHMPGREGTVAAAQRDCDRIYRYS